MHAAARSPAPSSRSRRPRVAIAIATVAIFAGIAAATPAADLVKEFHAGIDAYRLGKYDEARAHLTRALALDPALPGPHRFLAAVARAQGQWAECLVQTRQAIRLNPRSREIADTRKLHNECRAALGRPGITAPLGEGAAIAVTANVVGATVRIAGLRHGTTPLAPRRIRPGSHLLVIGKQGYRPVHRTIEALPGIITDVEIVLESESPPGEPPRTARERAASSVR